MIESRLFININTIKQLLLIVLLLIPVTITVIIAQTPTSAPTPALAAAAAAQSRRMILSGPSGLIIENINLKSTIESLLSQLELNKPRFTSFIPTTPSTPVSFIFPAANPDRIYPQYRIPYSINNYSKQIVNINTIIRCSHSITGTSIGIGLNSYLSTVSDPINSNTPVIHYVDILSTITSAIITSTVTLQHQSNGQYIIDYFLYANQPGTLLFDVFSTYITVHTIA